MRHLLGAFSLDAFLITGNGTRIHSVEGECCTVRISTRKWRISCCTAPGIRRPVCTSLTIGAGLPEEIPELLHAHVFSGFKYQLIDLRRIPRMR
jgi:HMP-PP phosphatase